MGVSPSISDNEIKIELMELIPISIEAVSYTHLDVYKRQAQILPVEQICPVRRNIHTADNIQQGSLAGAGRSHNGDKIPFFNNQINIC